MVKQASGDNLQQKFSIAWAILTLLLALVISFYQWEHLKYKQLSQLQLQASHLAYKLDNFVDSIFAAVDLLPLDKNQVKNCQSSLLTQLQSIVFNSPIITGIIVYNPTNQFVCTTFDPKAPLPNPYIQQQVLLGPMKTKEVDNDFFLLQRPYHDYYLGVYLLKSSLELLIHIDELDFKAVSLYDTQKKQIILGSNTLITDQPVTPITIKDLENDNKKVLIMPLESLKNVNLIISTAGIDLKKNLLFRLLLTILPLLLLSWLLHRYFQATMNKHFSITLALNDALKLQQFYPTYQPIFSSKTKQIYGAEVLIRWVNNENELIMPDYFIEDAEHSGLIVPITLQLIEKALSESKDLFANNPSFHLSFNLCPSHFKSESFFNDFVRICDYYHILPEQIMLELTERELFEENEQYIINKMQELRAKGYSLAIDDFGTGHASIKYLQHFPFNYLKIDKIFIQSIGTGAITETLNDAIINMANSLKLNIIAEGVETEQQFNYLNLRNVEFLQGWYFSKAVNFQQLHELIVNTGKHHV
ncbi:EAL domain-containing protein [Legionella sp. D16C41]|uniref:EAL domain-containing protein n=1 Tax=Legionella sp. D16C41 TaxID=3402688 RepID=UPI003AF6DBB9